MFQDIRRAWRSLVRQPAFALTAILILGVGIGANTAVFSVANAVLLRPLPYPEQGRLVSLFPETPVAKFFVAGLDGSDAFEVTSPHVTATFTLSSGEGGPERVAGAWVGAKHFTVLRSVPEMGRAFVQGENQAGEDGSVVLSYGLWQRRFGGDVGLVGSSIEIDGMSRTVVGVMPDSFQPVQSGRQLWIPLRIDSGNEKDFLGSFYLDVVGRLRQGISVQQASLQLRNITSTLREQHPNLVTEEHFEGAYAMPLHQHLRSSSRGVLLLLLAVVGCVLLITCSNVANLVLARVVRRRRELATRSALGAGRPALVRLLLAEGIVVGGLGAASGLLLASWLISLFGKALPVTLSKGAMVEIDGIVLLFVLGLALVAVLLFGLLPAFRASRSQFQNVLRVRGVGGGVGARRVRAGMVIAQIAVATVLLVSAGLLSRSLRALQRVDPGFRSENLLTFEVTPPGDSYSEQGRQVDFYRRVVEQLRAVPGVDQVGGIHLLPLTEGNWRFPYFAEGHPVVSEGDGPTTLPDANFRIVTPGYFEAIGTRLVAGRNLRRSDDAQSGQVAMINRTLAEQWWSAETAVGKMIQLFGDGGPELTVVGVVENVRQHGLDAATEPELYQAHAQWPNLTMNLILRTGQDPAGMTSVVRRAIWEVDSEVPISDIRSMVSVIRGTIADERLVSSIVVVISTLAFGLGMFGLYGVISYAVAGRQREFGIRMAFGAQRSSVLALVLRHGLVTALAGITLGILLSLASGKLIRSYLFAVEAMDRATVLAVVALVAGTALVSCVVPAWRATRVNPATVLRGD